MQTAPSSDPARKKSFCKSQSGADFGRERTDCSCNGGVVFLAVIKIGRLCDRACLIDSDDIVGAGSDQFLAIRGVGEKCWSSRVCLSINTGSSRCCRRYKRAGRGTTRCCVLEAIASRQREAITCDASQYLGSIEWSLEIKRVARFHRSGRVQMTFGAKTCRKSLILPPVEMTILHERRKGYRQSVA